MLMSPTESATRKQTDDTTKANCSEAETIHEEPGVAGSNGPDGTVIFFEPEPGPITQLPLTVKLVANANPQTADKQSKGSSAQCNIM